MWALVQRGVVIETTDIDPTGRYHSDLIWRKAPDDTPIGARLSGSVFLPANSPSLEELRVAKLISVNRSFEAAAQEVTAGYPPGEQLTWAIQSEEAKAWSADPDSSTPFLDGVAVVRGISKADMRARTFAQTQTFMTVSQQLVGKRQRLSDKIAIAKTIDELNAINW